MQFKPHQQRVVAERDELIASQNRLCVFIDSETAATLPQAERMLLQVQLDIMQSLVGILNQRIRYWIDNPVLTLADSIDINLPVAELYARVQFTITGRFVNGAVGRTVEEAEEADARASGAHE
jgi:hypothetical protein